MAMTTTTLSMTRGITDKLMIKFGKTQDEASPAEIMMSCAYWMRERMALQEVHTRKDTERHGKKQVHYLSLEFLMGRSLMKNAYNLGILPDLEAAIRR